MRTRALSSSVAAFVLLTGTFFALVSPSAHAANITWDGGGNDNKFNTATNWSGDVLPTAGDVIVFDADTMAGVVTLDNDIPGGLTVAGISLIDSTPGSGTSPNLIINGNQITVAGDIVGSSSFYFPQLNIDLVLGADVNIDGSFQISEPQVVNKTINLNSHNLSFSAVASSDVRLNSQIIGNGNVTISQNAHISLNRQNTFTGAVTVQGSVEVKNTQALGNIANNVTVSGTTGLVNFCVGGGSVANPFTLNSSNPNQGAIASTSTCGWFAPSGPSTGADITLSGDVTLMQDTNVWADGEIKLTGALAGPSYKMNIFDGVPGKLTVAASSNNTATANGVYVSNKKTTTVSDTSKTDQTISYNRVVIVNAGAEAGTIYMYGGALMGVGKVGNINMSAGAVMPGMSPGVLSSGNFTSSGGSFEEEIGGTASGEYDQLNVTGTVNLGSATALNISHWNNYRPSLGNSFIIINNDGADAVSGAFAGLPQGATVTVDDIVYTISYTGGDGNDVVLTVSRVPNPPTTPNTGFERVGDYTALAIMSTVIAGFAVAYTRRIAVRK